MRNLCFWPMKRQRFCCPACTVRGAVPATRENGTELRRLCCPAVCHIPVWGVPLTGAGTMYDALQRGLEWNAGQVNLLPFSREADPMGYALNVVLFLPFGLLPLLWPALDRLGRVAAGGFAFSLLDRAQPAT